MRDTLKPILCAIALVLPMATAASAQEEALHRTLSVSAEGHVAVPPDMAIVRIGVVERRDTAAGALAAMSTATQAVLDRMTTAGVAADDMQTSQLMLNPVFESYGLSGDPKVSGFEASTMLTVRIVDMAIVGKVLDAAVQDGANRLDGIQFGLIEPEPHMDTARIEAVQTGRARAELLADAAGVTLGPLVSMTEQGGAAPVMMRMEDMAMSMSVPLAEGDVNVTASVHMVFAIE